MSSTYYESLRRFRKLLGKKSRLETGFSMLEAIVVVGVLLALAVGGFLSYGPIVENAKYAKVRSIAASVYTSAMTAHFDGDSSTKPQDAIDNWNSSSDKVKTELLPPPDDAAMAAMTAGSTIPGYEPIPGRDFCVSASNIASPHITAQFGSCTLPDETNGQTPQPAPGSGNETEPGSGSTVEPTPPTGGETGEPIVEEPTPVGYVDPTPTLTKLTYRCDTTKSGFLPMNRNLVGTETWNDGTSQTYNGADNTTPKTLDAGITYTATFDGTYERFYSSDINVCLRSVDHWGANTGVINASNAFYGASNLASLPENIPTTITSMFGMFNKLNNFNLPAVSKWDVSNVTNMEFMFEGASSFNQPLNDWNVSKVTTMNSMLGGAQAFDQPLNKWNVSSVTNMRGLLGGASNFNQNINDWNVSNVTNMSGMLGAPKFNQPVDKWNTGKVADMSSMFQGASTFNQPLNTWNVSSVTNMTAMFMSASAFNQNLTNWTTSNVTNMNFMFNLASSFNGQIGTWDTSKVTTMTYMFEKAIVFNQPIGDWNVSSVGNMSYMFQDSPAFNQPIGNWNVSNVDNMRAMLQGVSAFNQPLDSWNVSKVTNMRSMFSGAKSFNQPLNSWPTTSLTTTKYMFSGARAFNQPLNNWDVSKVGDMAYMFYDTTVFNQNLSGWNTAALFAGGNFAPRATFTEGWQPPKTSLY